MKLVLKTVEKRIMFPSSVRSLRTSIQLARKVNKIENVEITNLTSPKFIKPREVKYTQNGTQVFQLKTIPFLIATFISDAGKWFRFLTVFYVLSSTKKHKPSFWCDNFECQFMHTKYGTAPTQKINLV